MSTQFPVIQITLDGMRHTIQSAFTNYLAEQDEHVQKALKTAVENFNVAEHIDKEIRAQFPAIISEIVRDAIRQAVWNNEALRKQLSEQLSKALAETTPWKL